MTKQDKLKKLAEMAGKEVYKSGEYLFYDTVLGYCIIYNPLEDMNQALECWRASDQRYFRIHHDEDGFSCMVDDECRTGKTEAEALCNALLEISQ